MYWDEDQEYNNDMIFSVSGFPYDISEEWHFQLSTLKEVPFSYEFITRIKEFVKYFEDMMQIHHSIELLREHHNIIPYPCR
jgi:hypothetical protein